MLAGINASLSLRGKEPLVLSRGESYIGTLVDDLVTKGTNEPYRMMTSRSEYRLLLRQDNADSRLTPIGHEVGLISDSRYFHFLEKQRQIEEEINRLETTYVSPAKSTPLLKSLGEVPTNGGASLADLLRRPAITYEALAPVDEKRAALPRRVLLTVETKVKYAGYIKRQLAEVERHRRLELKKLPQDLDYNTIKGLRLEAAQKLNALRPDNIGQASRISGVNPADISVLLIYFGMR